MADEIAILRQLQSELNSAFEAVYAAEDASALANAKETLAALTDAINDVAQGPVLSIIKFVGLVSSAFLSYNCVWRMLTQLPM
jgi:hypothetical protein